MKACSRAKKIFKSFPLDVQKYFLKLDKKLQNQGITFFLGSGRNIYSGGRCAGYFCPTNKILAVAIGGSLESSLSTLFHEYSHYQQHKNKSSVWHNYRIYNGHQRFFNYLSGKRIYNRKQAVMGAIKIEVDCERRAIKLAKSWQKYINLENYCSAANSCILSYHHMLKTGKWYKKSPCDKKIVRYSPNRLLRSYSRVPKRLEAAFDKHL